MYVYIQSEPGLWTVGHHAPGGMGPQRDWHPESDHESEAEAAKRCNYLNGGDDDRRDWDSLTALLMAANAALTQLRLIQTVNGTRSIRKGEIDSAPSIAGLESAIARFKN